MTQACTATQPWREGYPATKGGRCPALSLVTFLPDVALRGRARVRVIPPVHRALSVRHLRRFSGHVGRRQSTLSLRWTCRESSSRSMSVPSDLRGLRVCSLEVFWHVLFCGCVSTPRLWVVPPRLRPLGHRPARWPGGGADGTETHAGGGRGFPASRGGGGFCLRRSSRIKFDWCHRRLLRERPHAHRPAHLPAEVQTATSLTLEKCKVQRSQVTHKPCNSLPAQSSFRRQGGNVGNIGRIANESDLLRWVLKGVEGFRLPVSGQTAPVGASSVKHPPSDLPCCASNDCNQRAHPAVLTPFISWLRGRAVVGLPCQCFGRWPGGLAVTAVFTATMVHGSRPLQREQQPLADDTGLLTFCTRRSLTTLALHGAVSTFVSSTLVASGVRLSGVQFPSCCRCLRLSGCTALSGYPKQSSFILAWMEVRSLPRFLTGSTLWKARAQGGTTTMHRCRLRSHPRVRSVIDSIQTRLDLVGNIWSPSSCEPLVQLAQSLLSVGRALD